MPSQVPKTILIALHLLATRFHTPEGGDVLR